MRDLTKLGMEHRKKLINRLLVSLSGTFQQYFDIGH
jgi:hypothetical protein